MMSVCDLLAMKTYTKGSEIHEEFEQKHLIYFIKKGHVKIIKREPEKEVLKYVLGKGNIFGESKIINDEEPEPYTAIAMSECIICFIEVDCMEELIVDYPKLHNSIHKLAGLKFKRIERRLNDIIYKDAETRIKDFIVDYVKENGIMSKAGLTAKNIFSHKNIAELTSTSRQTVNNTISLLRINGELQFNRSEIVLVKKRG
jgi:CRP/FNR family transcriptional regulator